MNDEKTQAIDHLAAMRLLTEWTGRISENQVKTLNLWPSVMIPGIKSHRVAINLDEHKVVFHLNMKPGKTLKDLTPLTRIESGVWALLGDSWHTVVRAGKQVVYFGTRRKGSQSGHPNTFSKGREGLDAKRKTHGKPAKIRKNTSR